MRKIRKKPQGEQPKRDLSSRMDGVDGHAIDTVCTDYTEITIIKFQHGKTE